LVGDIIQRFERRGYKLVAIKVVQPSEAFAKQHYADLSQKPFFPGLVRYFSSGPVVAMVWEGKGVIAGGRKIIGATNPSNAEPGSIRGDFCVEVRSPVSQAELLLNHYVLDWPQHHSRL
jgi:nucleoside-diphosphate kinase